MSFQVPLPEPFASMPDDQAAGMVSEIKARLGDRLVILGHHYQRDEVFQFADLTGDSLGLSRQAAEQQAEVIVFCGVHFMAESADILTSPEQQVILPDLSAGCPMADMAEINQVEQGWQWLKEHHPRAEHLIPVCYVNSSAAIKAFCGRHGGLSCTSGNSRGVFEHVFNENPHALLFFLPDEHLGRNTAYRQGIPLEETGVWDPFVPGGGLAEDTIESLRVVLWRGYCHVHQVFTVEDVRRVREEDSSTRIMVHPECSFEVVNRADYVGSTAAILSVIRQAEPGSKWVVGTERHMVERLAREMAEKDITVSTLTPPGSVCDTMARIDLQHLAWVLDGVARHFDSPAEPVPNRIEVPVEIRDDARKALERMLALQTKPSSF